MAIQQMQMTYGGGKAIPLFTDFVDDPANRGAYTFEDVNIGTPSDDRYIIIGVLAHSNVNLSLVDNATVGGQSMTKLVEDSPAQHAMAWFISDAPVTTGTIADIFIDPSHTCNGANIRVYAVTGLKSTTPVDTYENQNDDGAFTGVVDAGGFILAQTFTDTNSSFTWTGATEDSDEACSADTTIRVSSATALEGGNITVTTGSNLQRTTTAISMR